jgi:hypothetical protein
MAGGSAEDATAVMLITEEAEEGELERILGDHPVPGDAEALADGAGLVGVRFELLLVAGSGGGGIDEDGATGFEVLEPSGLGKIEGHLGGIEDLEDGQFMTGGGEGGEVGFELIDGGEEIGDQHDATAAAEEFGGPLERGAELGVIATGRLVEGEEEAAEVTGAMAGGEQFADGGVEGEKAGGIALAVEEIGEGRGEGGSVGGLGPGMGGEGHGPALVHQEVAAEVGFVLESFDEVAVTSGEDPPIEVTEVIAGGVFAVLGELDGKPVVRAAVEAGPEAFDDGTGAPFQIAHGHEDARIDEPVGVRGVGIGGGIHGRRGGNQVRGLVGAGTDSKRRWMT